MEGPSVGPVDGGEFGIVAESAGYPIDPIQLFVQDANGGHQHLRSGDQQFDMGTEGTAAVDGLRGRAHSGSVHAGQLELVAIGAGAVVRVGRVVGGAGRTVVVGAGWTEPVDDGADWAAATGVVAPVVVGGTVEFGTALPDDPAGVDAL